MYNKIHIKEITDKIPIKCCELDPVINFYSSEEDKVIVTCMCVKCGNKVWVEDVTDVNESEKVSNLIMRWNLAKSYNFKLTSQLKEKMEGLPK